VRIEEGRKHIVRGIRRSREQWQVLITAHHEGYIDWETYEHNQRVIADNANMKGEMVRGSLRRGEALLAHRWTPPGLSSTQSMTARRMRLRP
jgi:hypothetical protein